MKILVCSCDKDDDTFESFHHCMEKYWKKHPEVIYTTENIINPYYKTICKNYSLDKWTKRIRETLQEIDDNQVLLMIDDIFIRNKVDTKRLEEASKLIQGNVAMINLEKAFDSNDENIGIEGFKKRKHGACYELSIMCGLWDKDKLIKVLEKDSDPWTVEYGQETKGYDYLINDGDYIIDWGYRTWNPPGICKGKWCREVVPFFEKEGIKVDYEKRGFSD